MVPRQYVHLLLLISELLIIIAMIILIVKGFGKDWKHKIWMGSKILTIEKIMFNNSYRLYPLLSIEPEIRYNYSYEYLLKHSRKNCEENYKKCGILDTYGNVMCIPEKDDCPINDIIVNFDYEGLSKESEDILKIISKENGGKITLNDEGNEYVFRKTKNMFEGIENVKKFYEKKEEK